MCFAGGDGVSRSTDNGANWSVVGLWGSQVYALTFNSNGQLFAGTDGGAFRSTDKGSTWVPISYRISGGHQGYCPHCQFKWLFVCWNNSMEACIRANNQHSLWFRKKISLPSAFVLKQNYPNPFNPTTTISYSLPYRSNVRIVVTNTLGQQVATLENGDREAGIHEVEWQANYASGIYFYRIEAVSTSNSKSRFVQVKEDASVEIIGLCLDHKLLPLFAMSYDSLTARCVTWFKSSGFIKQSKENGMDSTLQAMLANEFHYPKSGYGFRCCIGK